jgi:hypothetical protein
MNQIFSSILPILLILSNKFFSVLSVSSVVNCLG